MIDWTNPKCKITKNFSVKEMIFLPTWNRLATEADGLDTTVKSNLERLAKAMESVRAFVESPINVHVSYRPKAYNDVIGGSKNSSHMRGLACDFHVVGYSCDAVRKKLIDNKILDAFDLYMEDMPGSSWVHLNLDDGVKRSSRVFKP